MLVPQRPCPQHVAAVPRLEGEAHVGHIKLSGRVRRQPGVRGRERSVGGRQPCIGFRLASRGQIETAGHDEQSRQCQPRARRQHEPSLDGPQASHRASSLQQGEVRAHLPGGTVTTARIVLAGFEQDLVELHEWIGIGQFTQVRRQLREFLAVLARADLVQHLAETEEIRARRAGTFRRDEADGPDQRMRLLRARHQPDVRQLGRAPDEDDVRGLDVAVDETVIVQVFERAGECGADFKTLHYRQTSVFPAMLSQCFRNIIFQWIN